MTDLIGQCVVTGLPGAGAARVSKPSARGQARQHGLLSQPGSQGSDRRNPLHGLSTLCHFSGQPRSRAPRDRSPVRRRPRRALTPFGDRLGKRAGKPQFVEHPRSLPHFRRATYSVARRRPRPRGPGEPNARASDEGSSKRSRRFSCLRQVRRQRGINASSRRAKSIPCSGRINSLFRRTGNSSRTSSQMTEFAKVFWAVFSQQSTDLLGIRCCFPVMGAPVPPRAPMRRKRNVGSKHFFRVASLEVWGGGSENRAART
jgi:hypothetical protein